MPHAPAAQVAVPFAGDGQTLPQAPQFLTSSPLCTQVAPHLRYPMLQVKSQVPPVHTEAAFLGAGQAAPQLPQLPGSFFRSEQPPLQLVSPCGHETTQL